MPTFTVRVTSGADDADRVALEKVVLAAGGRIAWQISTAFSRAYGLVDTAASVASELATRTGATVFDSPIIAVAVCPSALEALPFLEEALGGPGRPAGVAGCERFGDSAIVEWNLECTAASTVFALVDGELARFRASRVTQMLAPLPQAWWVRIAAEGLSAPELTQDRILETQLERAGVDD